MEDDRSGVLPPVSNGLSSTLPIGSEANERFLFYSITI